MVNLWLIYGGFNPHQPPGRLGVQVLRSSADAADADDAERSVAAARSALRLAKVIAAWVVEQLGATPLGPAWSGKWSGKWMENGWKMRN